MLSNGPLLRPFFQEKKPEKLVSGNRQYILTFYIAVVLNEGGGQGASGVEVDL